MYFGEDDDLRRTVLVAYSIEIQAGTRSVKQTPYRQGTEKRS